MYAAQYPGPSKTEGAGENDPFMPIKVRHIAGHLNCQPELIFGRLYYHLESKYRYKQENAVLVSFFQINFEGRGHCVHFPYLASILAALDDDHRRNTWTFWFSVAALALSVAGILAQVITARLT